MFSRRIHEKLILKSHLNAWAWLINFRCKQDGQEEVFNQAIGELLIV